VERRDSKLELLQKMMNSSMNSTKAPSPGKADPWTRKPPRAANSWSAGQKINASRRGDESRNIAACSEMDASEHVVVVMPAQEDFSTNDEDDDSTNEISEEHKQNLLL
jgi:hypothetical protein